MLDLNDLRVFESVATLRSFSAAARALSQPKSNISRSVARLETELGMRVLQRTTRDVSLTPSGEALLARCRPLLAQLVEVLDFVGSAATPRGQLRLSAGIGFGINVIAEQLPEFLRRYPDVEVHLDLTSRLSELVGEGVDVAIRLGPLPDSALVAVPLGEMQRILCAAPAYLERRGTPRTVADLAAYEAIEMPRIDGRSRTWSFTREGRMAEVEVAPRVSVNDALTIHRLILGGAGLGIVSCYVCAPDIEAGRLVHLLPEWTAPPVSVAMVFPTKRELSATVRAFIEFMKEANPPEVHWLNSELGNRRK